MIHPTSPQPAPLSETVAAAMRKAFNLGQTYWQQADSESYSQNAKSDITRSKFDELLEETTASVATQPAPTGVPAAMQIVTDAMRADPEYAWSWHCNVAMAFVDAGGDAYTANQGAARFMRILANVEPAHELMPAPETQAPEGGELPPMPHPLLIAGGGQAWYSTDQMLDYARAALAAQPQACADGTPCVDCCQANEPCRREAPSPAEGADLPPLPAPRLYCHELIENKQLNPTLADMDGIWLGCNDLNVVQRSHTPGETGEEILALYTAEQMQTYTRSALTSKVQPKGTDDWRKLAQQFDGQRMAAMAHLRTLLAMPQAHAEAARAFLAASPAEQIASVAASPAPGAASIVTDAMVDRFLGWRLPDDFSPDGGVTFNPVQYGTVTAWPSGTNLFNATQARAMLEFVHANPPQAMTREWCADFPGSAAGIINRLAQRVDELEAAAKPAPAVGAGELVAVIGDGFGGIADGEEVIKQRLADALCKVVDRSGLKRKEVAHMLGMTEANLSIKLSGDTNLTVMSVANICGAVGANLSFRVEGDHV